MPESPLGQSGVSARVKWEPRDLWLGVYSEGERYPVQGGISRRVFVCLLPCLPIVLTFRRTERNRLWRWLYARGI